MTPNASVLGTRVANVITRLDGGAGVLAVRGLCALSPTEFRRTLIVGSGSRRLLDEAAESGIEVIVEPSIRPTIGWSDRRAVDRLRRLFGKSEPAVVHTHCAKAGVVGRLAARLAGVDRIVHTYHGFPFHSFQSRPRRLAYQAIERWAGGFTDRVLAVGTAVATEAIRLRLVEPGRVAAIGVAVDQLAPTTDPGRRAAARARLGIAADATVVGAVGRLTYQKAPEDFVAALSYLDARDRPDRAGIVGVWLGGGEYARRIRRLAEKTLPPGRVVFTDDRPDVADLLPAFDVFVLPSRYEGLPLAVVEAMICGIPVVATAVNAVPEVVISGRTGILVPPERPAALAAATGFLLDNPEVAARMVTAAGELARTSRYGVAELRDMLIASYTSDAPVGEPR